MQLRVARERNAKWRHPVVAFSSKSFKTYKTKLWDEKHYETHQTVLLQSHFPLKDILKYFFLDENLLAVDVVDVWNELCFPPTGHPHITLCCRNSVVMLHFSPSAKLTWVSTKTKQKQKQTLTHTHRVYAELTAVNSGADVVSCFVSVLHGFVLPASVCINCHDVAKSVNKQISITTLHRRCVSRRARAALLTDTRTHKRPAFLVLYTHTPDIYPS